MKKKFKLLGASIVLISILTVSSIAGDGGNGEVESNRGGNGEVLHHSFTEGKEKVEAVLNALYGKQEFIVRVFTKALKAVGSRGEDSYVPQRDMNVTNQDRLIIHANISEEEKPVTCNIPTVNVVQDENFATLDIDVQDIEDVVIITNRNKKVLMKYTIVK